MRLSQRPNFERDPKTGKPSDDWAREDFANAAEWYQDQARDARQRGDRKSAQDHERKLSEICGDAERWAQRKGGR